MLVRAKTLRFIGSTGTIVAASKDAVNGTESEWERNGILRNDWVVELSAGPVVAIGEHGRPFLATHMSCLERNLVKLGNAADSGYLAESEPAVVPDISHRDISAREDFQ